MGTRLVHHLNVTSATSNIACKKMASQLDSQPAKRQIHVIADNLSAHKTKKVFEFLSATPSARIHYAPTYSSWQD